MNNFKVFIITNRVAMLMMHLKKKAPVCHTKHPPTFDRFLEVFGGVENVGSNQFQRSWSLAEMITDGVCYPGTLQLFLLLHQRGVDVTRGIWRVRVNDEQRVKRTITIPETLRTVHKLGEKNITNDLPH